MRLVGFDFARRAQHAEAVAARHVPVLLPEMLAALAVRPGGVYLDATFGAGGYTRAILAAGAGRVLALDRDPAAIARGRRLAARQPRLTMLAGRFGDMADLLGDAGVDGLDGIVLDLGLSSDQPRDPGRGFSFAADGPLDMRMSRQGISAAELVNQADETTLADILYRYGEERAARRIARAVVGRRQRAPLERTRELAQLVAGVVGRTSGRPAGRIDPATRTFQALRIHVNDELGELERALHRGRGAAGGWRPPGDRGLPLARGPPGQTVPRGPQRRAAAALAPPAGARGEPPAARFRALYRHPLRPGPAELAANPRARSARLRAALRLAEPERRA